METIWKKTARLPSFPRLEGERKADALVIGGGIAGILCARALTSAGLDVILVEAGQLCGGVTGNTTAKITIQHGLFAERLLRRLGAERAGEYLRFQQAALERYRTLCGRIDCSFEKTDSYVYSLRDRAALEREIRALEALGVPAALVETPALPLKTVGAALVPGQARFHPLKFLAAIAEGLKIYENTRVLTLAPGLAKTERGAVRAERVVVATHFPFLDRHGGFFLKQYQDRSYVLALEGAPEVNGMYVDEAAGGLSFRRAGNLLLLGGRGGRTGKKHGGWSALARDARELYPEAKEAARWAAQDCMTLDGLPYIGQYSKRTPGLYVATGFNKWGMTSSMAAALLLRDLILERENPCAALLSPSRSALHPQLAVNGFEAALNLLSPTVPRCPHLGCALRWNRAERSWDCPCHGSRFAEDGSVLNGPANGPKPSLRNAK